MATKDPHSSSKTEGSGEKEKVTGNQPNLEEVPPGKIPNPYLAYLKKIGFTVWLSVMIIGGILAFITSLLLL